MLEQQRDVCLEAGRAAGHQRPGVIGEADQRGPPAKMNAAVVTSFDEPPHYQQFEVPQPAGAQVRYRQ